MKKELPKTYEPQEVEGRIYAAWEQAGCFKTVRDPDKKPFTIVIPPPNITGQLHMGHALNNTLQDIIIRYKRSTMFTSQSTFPCNNDTQIIYVYFKEFIINVLFFLKNIFVLDLLYK